MHRSSVNVRLASEGDRLYGVARLSGEKRMCKIEGICREFYLSNDFMDASVKGNPFFHGFSKELIANYRRDEHIQEMGKLFFSYEESRSADGTIRSLIPFDRLGLSKEQVVFIDDLTTYVFSKIKGGKALKRVEMIDDGSNGSRRSFNQFLAHFPSTIVDLVRAQGYYLSFKSEVNSDKILV